MTTPTKTASGPKPEREPAQRNCLKCDRSFMSKGPHNWLCERCRSYLGYRNSP